MEKTIVLPSTQKGYVSDCIWGIIWFVSLWFFASWGHSFSETMMDSETPVQLFVFIVAMIAYVVMPLIVLYILYTVVYSTRAVNTFYQDKGFWNKLSCDSYGFPFSKTNTQIVFDRIIQIEVIQGSISRLLNTGTLKVKMITFTNADSKEEDWFIYGINNPYDRKAELEEALMDHEGLTVKMSNETR